MAEWYGDPLEPISNLMPPDGVTSGSTPQVGDELCDGHMAHYVWNGERWT